MAESVEYKTATKYKGYKTCFVPLCTSTTISTPDKIFVSVPKADEIRKKWVQACRRDEEKSPLSKGTACFCCEDHFNMEEDFENYRYAKTMGGRFFTKKGIVPHIFHCQPIQTGNNVVFQKGKRCRKRNLVVDEPEIDVDTSGMMTTTSLVQQQLLSTADARTGQVATAVSRAIEETPVEEYDVAKDEEDPVNGNVPFQSMSYSDLQKIHYLDCVDDVTLGVRRAALIGDERLPVYLPLLVAVAACPILAGAIDSECNCNEDVVVVVPSVATRNLQMFVNYIMGKTVCGTYEDAIMLENICLQFGIKLDLSPLMTDSASQVYAHAVMKQEDDNVTENDVEKERESNFDCFLSENYEEQCTREEVGAQFPHVAVELDMLHSNNESESCDGEDAMDDSLTCTVCKKRFTRQRQLQVHRCAKSRNGGGSSLTSRESNAVSEASDVTGGTILDGKLQCQLCRQCFTEKTWYRAHLAEHNGAKVHKCGKCEGCFLSEAGYKIHMQRKHSNMKHYKPRYNNKKFLTVAARQAHEVKPCVRRYKCKYCNRKYADRHSCKIHQYTHTEERPFQCKTCGKSFRMPQMLRKHWQKDHCDER